ncbi:hypothetical protein ABVT39_013874 [Epinephelus coioides]
MRKRKGKKSIATANSVVVRWGAGSGGYCCDRLYLCSRITAYADSQSNLVHVAITTRQESDHVAIPSTSSVSSGELRQLDISKHAPESSKDDESDSDTAEHETKRPPEPSQRTSDIMIEDDPAVDRGEDPRQSTVTVMMILLLTEIAKARMSVPPIQQLIISPGQSQRH